MTSSSREDGDTVHNSKVAAHSSAVQEQEEQQSKATQARGRAVGDSRHPLRISFQPQRVKQMETRLLEPDEPRVLPSVETTAARKPPPRERLPGADSAENSTEAKKIEPGVGPQQSQTNENRAGKQIDDSAKAVRHQGHNTDDSDGLPQTSFQPTIAQQDGGNKSLEDGHPPGQSARKALSRDRSPGDTGDRDPRVLRDGTSSIRAKNGKTTGEHQESSSTLLAEPKKNASTPWGNDIHKHFVAAIFDVGISHASPSLIAEKMQLESPEVTSERLKSHLQKFRKRKQTEKDRFLEEYSRSLCRIESGEANVDESKNKVELGGKAAAIITHHVRKEEEEKMLPPQQQKLNTSVSKRAQKGGFEIGEVIKRSLDAEGNRTVTMVPLPVLTEKEKRGGLGRSILFIASLAEHMGKHLAEQRQASAFDPPPPMAPAMLTMLNSQLLRVAEADADGDSVRAASVGAINAARLVSTARASPEANTNPSSTASELESSSPPSGSNNFADFVGRHYFPIQEDESSNI